MKGLKIGQRVQLSWNGYGGVPKCCNHAFATVKGFKRKRIVVDRIEGYQGELTIRTDQIIGMKSFDMLKGRR